MKDIYISDLSSYEDGKIFDGFFLVLSRQQRTTQTNKPYLNFIFCDKFTTPRNEYIEVNDEIFRRTLQVEDYILGVLFSMPWLHQVKCTQRFERSLSLFCHLSDCTLFH